MRPPSPVSGSVAWEAERGWDTVDTGYSQHSTQSMGTGLLCFLTQRKDPTLTLTDTPHTAHMCTLLTLLGPNDTGRLQQVCDPRSALLCVSLTAWPSHITSLTMILLVTTEPVALFSSTSTTYNSWENVGLWSLISLR